MHLCYPSIQWGQPPGPCLQSDYAQVCCHLLPSSLFEGMLTLSLKDQEFWPALQPGAYGMPAWAIIGTASCMRFLPSHRVSNLRFNFAGAQLGKGRSRKSGNLFSFQSFEA